MEKNDKVRNVLCPSFLKSLFHLNVIGGIFAYAFNAVTTSDNHIMLGFFHVEIAVTSRTFPTD